MKAERASRLVTVEAPGAATLLTAMRNCDLETSTTAQRG